MCMPSFSDRVKQLEATLKQLEADGLPDATLKALRAEIKELQAQEAPPAPPPPPLAPPSPQLQRLDETLRGLQADGIPVEQLEPLEQQIRELRAREGAAPAAPTTSSPPPPTTPEPTDNVRNAMASLFGTFGVSARDLTADELQALERRESAAQEARERENARSNARQQLDGALAQAERGVERLLESVQRARAVLDRVRRDGSDALRYLGEEKREERRGRIDATIGDLLEAVQGARSDLYGANRVCKAAGKLESMSALSSRSTQLVDEAELLLDELVDWREQIERALSSDASSSRLGKMCALIDVDRVLVH